MSRSTHPSRAGFTLLELLVAIAIVALMSGVLAASLHVGLTARRSAENGLAVTRSLRLAMDALGKDMHGALPRMFNTDYGLIGTFVGQEDVDSQGRASDNLTFSNTANPLRNLTAAADVEDVELLVVAPQDLNLSTTPDGSGASTAADVTSNDSTPVAGDEGVLVRRVQRRMLANPALAPYDQVLCRHVRSFTLSYYDGSQWTSTWDSSTTAVTNALPVAVQVTLEVADVDAAPVDGQAPSVTWTQVFAIPAGTSLSTSSTTN